MKRGLDRRTVLRGLGVVVALPWLEAMSGCAVRASEPSGTRRFVTLTLPNGMPVDAWRSTGSGAAWTPSPILAELGSFTSSCTVVEGLVQRRAIGEPHHGAAMALLTGRATPPWEVAEPASFVSVDQVVARALGEGTRVASLQLGSDPAVPCSEAASGQQPTCAGYWTPCWADADTPLLPTLDPARAFARLFDTGEVESADARARRARYGHGVLDAVRGDAASLSARLGASDRARLDQYLTGLHDVERAIDALPTPSTGACAEARDAFLSGAAIDAELDHEAHVTAMLDLIVLALQCDATRVVSYILGSERSDRPYPQLGIAESHHWLSHHGGDAARLAKITQIGQWEVRTARRLLDRLAAVPDGAGTLLDQTTVLVAAGLSDPDTHSDSDLPVFVVGGGTEARGRVVRAGAPLARLHLALLDHLGVSAASFGDEGTAPLDVW